MKYQLKKISDSDSLSFFRQKSEPVTKEDKDLSEIIENMSVIMCKNNAIGIAAVMIGIHKRIVVVDLQENNRRKPIILLNPEIVSASDETIELDEASISLDNVVCKVKRSKDIRVKYFDTNFDIHELSASGLLAICLQHEIDYLDGKLFFDYIADEERNKIISAIESELKIKNIIDDIDILRTECKPIKTINEKTEQELDKMLEIMYNNNGVGLAANQVGLIKRMVVIDIQPKGEKQPIFLINPKITWYSDNYVDFEEGCLSVPGYSAKIKRPEKVKIEYTDRNSEKAVIEADGLLARCLQHELDHLDGKIYIDYLSKLKRDIIVKKVKKQLNA